MWDPKTYGLYAVKERRDYRLLLSTWLKYLTDEALDSVAPHCRQDG